MLKRWGRGGEEPSEKASKGHMQTERGFRREGSPRASVQDLEPLLFLLCSRSLVLLWMPDVDKEVGVLDWLYVSSQTGQV